MEYILVVQFLHDAAFQVSVAFVFHSVIAAPTKKTDIPVTFRSHKVKLWINGRSFSKKSKLHNYGNSK